MKLKVLFAVIALSLALAGCGNKGPLVLPSHPAAGDVVAPPEAAPPAPTVPADEDTAIPPADVDSGTGAPAEEPAPPPTP